MYYSNICVGSARKPRSGVWPGKDTDILSMHPPLLFWKGQQESQPAKPVLYRWEIEYEL